MERRGQDLSIGTVVLIVLGLAVLVFLIIGFTRGFDFFFGNLETVDPGKLQVFAKACEGYAQGGLTISYCQFKEIETIGGVRQYYNCDSGQIENLLNAEGVTTIDCPLVGGVSPEKDFCNNYQGDSEKVKLNGQQSCSQISGNSTVVQNGSN